jgi:hypothetical protein
MKLPWMTTRRLMVAVAIVALLLASQRIYDRRARMSAIASNHAKREKIELMALAEYRSFMDQLDPERAQSTLKYLTSSSKYHADMRRKYERAARYPWLPLSPDPPSPK